jgi:hypothetical protein
MPKKPLAKVASVCETVAGDVVMMPHHSRGIDHGAVCGLLMERLHNVSVCFVCHVGLFVDGYICDLRVFSKHAISLTKEA